MRNPIRRGINLAKRIGRRFRSRARVNPPSQQASAPLPQFSSDPSYDAWLQQNHLTAERLREAEMRAHTLQFRPLISVVMPVYDSDLRCLAIALQSVKN